MLCGLDDLDGDVVTNLQVQIWWHTDLWYTDLTAVHCVVWSHELERRHNWMRHVWWVGIAVKLQTDIDVDQGVSMTWEPAWLERYGSSIDRPLRAILSERHASA